MSHAAGSFTPLSLQIRVRLSLMMFLQYFVWGAWFVTLGGYIGGNTGKIGMGIFESGFTGVAYGTAAIGGMLAPFFVGMIADRFFSSERILAVLHLAGAGIMYYLSTLTDQSLIYYVLIGYFLTYMPTLALTNSLSFHHLPNPDRQFPGIRVLGTIGWIVAGALVGDHLKLVDGQLTFVWSGADLTSIEATTIPMRLAAIGQALLGVYSLTLPHTPPKNVGHKVTAGDIIGLDALKLMKRRRFAVFVIGSFLIAIPLQFYYNYTNFYFNSIGVANAAGVMKWGQVSEIFFMLLIPWFFLRLGVKKMLLVGMLAWAVRYGLFSAGDAGSRMWMLFIGILLHGICYDFFFVTGQMYVDREADPSIRGAAQGFIAFATLGVGSFIGAELSAYIEKLVTIEQKVDGVTTSVIQWNQFWLYPAAGAAAVMLLFALTFYDRDTDKAAA
ncbi:MAG: nucleoside permease [Pirellulales bacterium]